MIAQPTKGSQLANSDIQQKIVKNPMIAQPTNCPQLEGSSNQQTMGENWMIAQPTKCPQLEGSSQSPKNSGKLDDCPTDKLPSIRRF